MFAPGNSTISAIAIAPSKPPTEANRTIYIGLTGRADVVVFRKSTDGGKTFDNKIIPTLPLRYITSIAVAPRADNPKNEGKIVYVAFSGFNPERDDPARGLLAGHVFKSIDGGDTWVAIGGKKGGFASDLPDVPVNALVLDPAKPGKIYVGTDVGVFETTNDGATWSEVGEATLPNVAVFDLKLNNLTNTLYAATYGRGVWKLQTSCEVALSPNNLPNGKVGQNYAQTITAMNGTAPFMFDVDMTKLPPGLKLTPNSPNTAIITGTPTTAGTYDFIVTSTDALGCAGSRAYRIIIGLAGSITFSPNQLPDATQGIAYNQSFTAEGGQPTYTYMLTEGSLPSGLNLSPLGGITGTPTESGVFTFSITLTDAQNNTIKQDYTIKVVSNCASISLSPTTLQTGKTRIDYAQPLIASGGNAPYRFAITSGSLPGGLKLSENGFISGTATTVGNFTFVVTVTDANNCTFSQGYNLTIFDNILVLPETLPNGRVGDFYNLPIIANGGAGNYTFTIDSAPSGFSLSSSGQFSGTPDTAGKFSFTVTAKDRNGLTGSRTYTIIICGNIFFNQSSLLPNATINAQYQQSITADGSGAPYNFSVQNGLPTGLTISPNGLITGKPIASGNFLFSVIATDANGCQGFQNFSLTVDCLPISISPGTIADAMVDMAYNQSIKASGGLAPYKFTSDNPLPDGLMISSSGVISGIPRLSGVFTIVITVTDNANCSNKQFYNLKINKSVTCPKIGVSPLKLPDATASLAYAQNVIGTGGQAPYSFALIGTIPPGLSFSANGLLSGTPTTQGTFSFSIVAKDVNECVGSQNFTLVVAPKPCPSISLSPGTLPNATIALAYSQTVIASGGQAPYTFTSTGQLPSGFTLSSSGLISGTTNVQGSFTFTVIAKDANNCTGSQTYTVNVNCPIITFSPSSLSSGTINTLYSQNISANGGQAPYIFSLTGALPNGLVLSSSGVISGTPTTLGTFSFTINVKDANNCTNSQAYVLTIAAPTCPTITLSPNSLPNGTMGIAYNQSVVASGGQSPYSFAASGNIPLGLNLSSIGILSGIALSQGSFSFTITATDANNCTGSQSYSIVILPPPCPTIILNPSSLPNGAVNSSYSQSISASGGQAPYTFTVSGIIPPGLSFSASGLLSGTPTTQGTFGFMVTAKDVNNCSASRSYTITITAPACPTIILDPTSLPGATETVEYSQTITASGGVAPYSFTLTSGVLPPGLSLSGTGTISGTPTQSGTFSFIIKATDNNGCFGTQSYTLEVGVTSQKGK
ncbi:MAG: putative Ig domain-containing protein [Acidobacteria bacterium]|nr:putative Ig domain-containing protein [Acidobacteriota bacterium]